MLRIKQEVASSAASDKLVPLKQVRVDTKIHSFAADVTITQVFQNDESVPVEAVYCFPVEENAAIYGFVARIDDEREIVAQIKEKKAAQQEYTQALAQGHGAYLLEQDEASNDIFIISVGARDIIVDVELSDVRRNTIAAIDNGAVMISFIPTEQDCRQDSNNATNEFFFVIDCSGSMAGDDKIGLARKAMLLFLKSLPVNCRFNIIRFGSSFSALFTDQVTREYNKTNMCQAEAMIKDMTADLGGTELLKPLHWLKENKPSASGPSRALVKGLARTTNGYFNFIAPHTNVDIYVAEQLSRALQPSIADVYVKWNTNQRILHKVPEHAPPVFVGDRLLFYALLDETMPFDHTTTVELFTGIQQQPIGLARVDHVPSVLGSQLVMHLAAKALLRELSDDQKTIDKELLVNISIKYGILCPYTAFIGVERRLDVNSESNVDMELREVPIMISKTGRESVTRFRPLSNTSSLRYQSLSSDINRLNMDICCNIESIAQRDNDLSIIMDHCCELDTSSKQFYKTGRQKNTFSASIGSVLQPAINFVSSLFPEKRTTRFANHSDSKPVTSSTSVDIYKSLHDSSASNNQTSKMIWPTDEQKLVDRFIELQQYDGLWILTADDVNQLTGKSFTTFSSSMVEKLEKNTQQSIITTAIVIILLETRCLALKTLWQALSNKAYKCLKDLLGGDESKLEKLMKDIRDQFQ
ncbi:unnamed protein product [Rotaria sp. Silwood2]|nr:unnamed protein product [Rotaria sp. Silwood2]